MEGFESIYLVTNSLINLLKKNFIPDFIQDEEKIRAVNLDSYSSSNIGIYLYHIEENMDYKNYRLRRSKNNKAIYPDMHLNLYYLFIIKSQGDDKFKILDEQKLMGRLIQTFYDNPVLKSNDLGDDFEQDLQIKIHMQNLTFDELSKIFSVPTKPYELCLAYKLSGIPIKSGKTREVSYVTKKDITISQKY